MVTQRENSEEREKNLKDFERSVRCLGDFYNVSELAPYIYIVHKGDPEERARITFVALTHGNEIAGFSILKEFISILSHLRLTLPFSIGVALGNTEAYKKDVRFLEKDLNRSFGLGDQNSLEGKRAKELTKLLIRTDFLLDFHQTQRPCLNPFFVFPYTKKGLSFALHLNSEIPVVTHWSGGFSKDGMCTDEFINSQGGVGISLETGFCGRDPLQISFGLKLIFEALFLKKFLENDRNPALPDELSEEDLKIYTWSEVFPYPEEGEVILKEDLINFSFFQKGEELGKHEGLAIKASEEGFLLFPKYVKSSDPRPKELFRLVRPISVSELP